jgi:sporulation protein YlmC with PRC-barrel domain
MSMSNRAVIGVAMLAAMSSLAYAQTGKPEQGKPEQGKDQGKVEKKVTDAPQWSVFNNSEIVGAKVFNDQGEELGKIDDVALYGNGQIAYAVLSYGGVLGVGDKLFALPWTLLRAAHHGDDKNLRMAINIDKDRLKNAPGFDKGKWPSGADCEILDSTDKYYAAECRTAEADRKSTGRAVEASARTPATVILRMSKLDGRNVENATGDKLGDIKASYIDPSYGRLNYVALSVGGFLGVGDRVVAVPWDAIKVSFTDNKEKLTLNATKEQLEKAPQYLTDKAKAKEMVDPSWIRSIYTYYNVNPYWNEPAKPTKG